MGTTGRATFSSARRFLRESAATFAIAGEKSLVGNAILANMSAAIQRTHPDDLKYSQLADGANTRELNEALRAAHPPTRT